MKAITELKNEHHGIELMLQIMDGLSDRMEKAEAVDVSHLHNIVEFLAGFADNCHHGKEESILFKALESESNPTLKQMLPQILDEHEQGRKIISEIKALLGKQAKPDNETLRSLSHAFNAYARLLKEHIHTENEVLFPGLELSISPALDEELFDAFEKLEAEVIGIGKHEAYHAMLEEYAEIYLKK